MIISFNLRRVSQCSVWWLLTLHVEKAVLTHWDLPISVLWQMELKSRPPTQESILFSSWFLFLICVLFLEGSGMCVIHFISFSPFNLYPSLLFKLKLSFSQSVLLLTSIFWDIWYCWHQKYRTECLMLTCFLVLTLPDESIHDRISC